MGVARELTADGKPYSGDDEGHNQNGEGCVGPQNKEINCPGNPGAWVFGHQAMPQSMVGHVADQEQNRATKRGNHALPVEVSILGFDCPPSENQKDCRQGVETGIDRWENEMGHDYYSLSSLA